MTKTIIIDPVSRIEGHAKISLYLDDAGNVADARFHVTEFRGFESFCVGRPLAEMPGLTARTCGICPVSHLMASAKAGDALLAVQIPQAATKLRRLMNLGQHVQSHALSFFHLSAPDFLLGWDSEPADRNVFGLMSSHPEIARKGIRLRQFGQEIIEALGGKRIHPAWAVPGGVRQGLSTEYRDGFLARLDEVRQSALDGIALLEAYLDSHPGELEAFGSHPGLYMGLVGADGGWEHYDGQLRIIDGEGRVLEHALDPMRVFERINEASVPWSFMKMPHYAPLGASAGAYRVGPLARLNVCHFIGTPLADEALAKWRSKYAAPSGIVNGTFHYHTARLIEILGAIEHIERLLHDPDLQSDRLRATAGINRLEAVGVSEAPRGTLFHQYGVDADGRMTRVNLMIATGQNNHGMNDTVKHMARHFIQNAGTRAVDERLLNRVEAGIRAYDPCLSCSTHAAGQMPLQIDVFDAGGQLRTTLRRRE